MKRTRRHVVCQDAQDASHLPNSTKCIAASLMLQQGLITVPRNTMSRLACMRGTRLVLKKNPLSPPPMGNSAWVQGIHHIFIHGGDTCCESGLAAFDCTEHHPYKNEQGFVRLKPYGRWGALARILFPVVLLIGCKAVPPRYASVEYGLPVSKRPLEAPICTSHLFRSWFRGLNCNPHRFSRLKSSS